MRRHHLGCVMCCYTCMLSFKTTCIHAPHVAHLANLLLRQPIARQALCHWPHVFVHIQAPCTGIALAQFGSVCVVQGVGVHGCVEVGVVYAWLNVVQLCSIPCAPMSRMRTTSLCCCIPNSVLKNAAPVRYEAWMPSSLALCFTVGVCTRRATCQPLPLKHAP